MTLTNYRPDIDGLRVVAVLQRTKALQQIQVASVA